ncbi:MAG: SusC/RagA family TonB-linked outer membrane protein [Chitinophagaceae bacterium]|nr:SusC/RagA family TonB-linked outer membrane protein [Chitinophagaceae bacterium]
MRINFLIRDPYARLLHQWPIIPLLSLFLFIQHPVQAQAPVPGKELITLKVENASIEEVLKKLRKVVKLQFIIDAGVSGKSKSAAFNMVNAPLSDVLDKMLTGTGLEYVINKNVVIIRKKATAEAQQESFDGRPSVTVTVIVKNEEGNPLQGATVTDASDPSRARITDIKGQSVLSIPPSSKLRISYIGFEPQTVVANEHRPVIVVLKNTQKAEEEVVVTGFQNLRKWESVGSTYNVKGEDVRIAGIPRVDIALQGQIPGVSITIPNGTVGSNPKIRVRGTSTLMGNREPVWVVDGIIREDPFPFKNQNLDDILNAADRASMLAGMSISGNGIAGLNPDDIEDITFLKDASATALYGVRAANGVIVITTKKGKAGRTNINFRSDWSITQKPSYRQTDLMNSAQRVALSRELIEKGVNYSTPGAQGFANGVPVEGPQNVGYEGLYYALINKAISQQEFNEKVTQLETNNTDWFDELFRNALNQNHTLSINGGSDKSTFYASFGYNTTAHSAIGNDQKRLSALMNMDYRLNARMRWHVGLNASSLNTNGFYTNVNPSQYALSTNRELTPDELYPMYNMNTNVTLPNGTTSTFVSRLNYNFKNERAHTGNTVDGKSFNFNTDLQVQILKSLSWQTMFAYNFDRTTTQRWADEYSYYVAQIRGANFGEYPKGSIYEQASVLARGGILEKEDMNRDGYLFRNILNFNRSLGRSQQHGLNFMGGMELRSNEYKGTATKNYGYFPDRGDVIDYDYSIVHNNLATDQMINKYYNRRTNGLTNFVSYFGSLTYSFNRKYTFNFNGRNDASNRFGQFSNAGFNPVWAIGARWDVLAEKWFRQRLTWINTLTVRSSFGFQGNIVESVGPNLIAQYNTPVYNPVTGEAYLNIKSMPYPDLRKEKTRTTNIGLDLSVLNNRFAVTFDFYYKYSKDLISLRTVPVEYGTLQMYVNGSDMENRGYDLSVRVVPVKTKDWNWSLQFNTSFNFNNVVKPKYTPTIRTLTNGTALTDGYPVDGFWSFDYAGLNPKTGKPMFRYLDVDTNLALLKNPDPTKYLVYSGNSTPRITGGLLTTIRYRNFMLTANFNMQLNYYLRLNPILLAGVNGQYQAPGADKNASRQLTQRWQKPGDEAFTDIPAIYARDESPSSNFGDGSIGTLGTAWYRYSMYNYSDLRVVNGSHLRCNNIVVSYTFTKQQLKRIKGLNTLSLSGNITNPFVIASSKLNGQDPEVLSIDANTVTPTIARMKTVSFSLNVGF